MSFKSAVLTCWPGNLGHVTTVSVLHNALYQHSVCGFGTVHIGSQRVYATTLPACLMSNSRGQDNGLEQAC